MKSALLQLAGWLLALALMPAAQAAEEAAVYTVLEERDGVEYRQYNSYLVVETVVSAAEDIVDYRDAGREGFRRLFRYLSGANVSEERLRMARPVAVEPRKNSEGAPVAWRIAFTLPADLTADTAPLPSDVRVQVREQQGRVVAALRYSGRWTDKNFARYAGQLMRTLDEQAVTPASAPENALYNAPFTPPFLRRNEILVELAGQPDLVEGSPPSESVAVLN